MPLRFPPPTQTPSTSSGGTSSPSRERPVGSPGPSRPTVPLSSDLDRLQGASPPQRGTSVAQAAATADLRLHRAVAGNDPGEVKALMSDGLRPVHLDDLRRSPLDLLDAMDMTPHARMEMRHALLRSKNPSAPADYAKPEALHGSPWSLEILVSGELKGGANDAKGGLQSLEGKVFFSDRTPSSGKDDFTRKDLRRQARTYSDGVGWKSTAASSRGCQHRMTQALLHSITQGRPLNTTSKPLHIASADAESARREVQFRLQEILNDAQLMFPRRKFPELSLEQMADAVDLPGSVLLDIGGSAREVMSGEALVEMYKAAAAALKVSLENGKAPFLALLNKGLVVPVVFGFEKISGLQAHVITGREDARSYSYQSKNHPLAGSKAGGRLKEIEVTSLQDLATLCLGAMVKGVDIPLDVLLRVKPRGREAGQATYLDAGQLREFRAHLSQEAIKFDLASANRGPGSAGSFESIEHLQTLNTYLRGQPLDEWVPSRMVGLLDAMEPVPPVPAHAAAVSQVREIASRTQGLLDEGRSEEAREVAQALIRPDLLVRLTSAWQAGRPALGVREAKAMNLAHANFMKLVALLTQESRLEARSVFDRLVMDKLDGASYVHRVAGRIAGNHNGVSTASAMAGALVHLLDKLASQREQAGDSKARSRMGLALAGTFSPSANGQGDVGFLDLIGRTTANKYDRTEASLTAVKGLLDHGLVPGARKLQKAGSSLLLWRELANLGAEAKRRDLGDKPSEPLSSAGDAVSLFDELDLDVARATDAAKSKQSAEEVEVMLRESKARHAIASAIRGELDVQWKARAREIGKEFDTGILGSLLTPVASAGHARAAGSLADTAPDEVVAGTCEALMATPAGQAVMKSLSEPGQKYDGQRFGEFHRLLQDAAKKHVDAALDGFVLGVHRQVNAKIAASNARVIDDLNRKAKEDEKSAGQSELVKARANQPVGGQGNLPQTLGSGALLAAQVKQDATEAVQQAMLTQQTQAELEEVNRLAAEAWTKVRQTQAPLDQMLKVDVPVDVASWDQASAALPEGDQTWVQCSTDGKSWTNVPSPNGHI